MDSTTLARAGKLGAASNSSAATQQTAQEAFVTSRTLDYFTKLELERQSGILEDSWAVMLLKEALDNSLDACEAVETTPTITIDASPERIIVIDNGPGIPHDTVRKVKDFSSTISTNRHRIRPTRGAQGNAFKTYIAVPYVMSGDHSRVEVVTPEGHLIINATLDAIKAEPEIEINQGGEIVKNGTKLTIHLPEVASHLVEDHGYEILQLIEAFAAFNPHMELNGSVNGYEFQYERETSKFEKWNAKKKSSPHWCSVEDVGSLLAAKIRQDGSQGQSLTLRAVIAEEFYGLSGSKKPPQVLLAAGMSKSTAADMVNGKRIDRDRISKLLGAMKEHTNPVKPTALGVVGSDRLRWAVCDDEDDFFKYARRSGVDANGLPFVVEVAFAYRADIDQRILFTGLNFSATLQPPIRQIDRWMEFGELLEDQRCGSDSHVAIAVHIVCPKFSFTDRAKQSLNINGALGDAVKAAITSATAEYARHKKAEEKSSKNTRDMKDKLSRPKKKVHAIDACFVVIPQCLVEVSENGAYPDIQARNLFYLVRKAIQSLTDVPLTAENFEKILKKYEAQFGIIDAIYRESRGFMIEPHTGKEVKLGTLDVRNYTIPPHLYSRVLFIEKRGFLPLLRQGQIAERYDILIICGEGYSTEALKKLMGRCSDANMQVFTLHDADPYGYHLSDKMRDATRQAKGVEVIDIGLQLDEALEMGLEMEDFFRKKALASNLVLRTPLEVKHFQGEQIWHGNKLTWKCQRVELNALASSPTRFINYLCERLEQHGCTKKLVPPDSVIKDRAKQDLSKRIREGIQKQLTDWMNLDPFIDDIAAELLNNNESTLNRDMKNFNSALSTLRWTAPIESWATESFRESNSYITSRLRDVMSGAIKGAADKDGDV